MDNKLTIRITIRILDMIFSHKLLYRKKIVLNLNVSYIFLQSSPYRGLFFLSLKMATLFSHVNR